MKKFLMEKWKKPTNNELRGIGIIISFMLCFIIGISAGPACDDSSEPSSDSVPQITSTPAPEIVAVPIPTPGKNCIDITQNFERCPGGDPYEPETWTYCIEFPIGMSYCDPDNNRYSNNPYSWSWSFPEHPPLVYPMNTAEFIPDVNQATQCTPKRTFQIVNGQSFTVEGPAIGYGRTMYMDGMLAGSEAFARIPSWLMFPTRIDNRFPDQFVVSANGFVPGAYVEVYEDNCIDYLYRITYEQNKKISILWDQGGVGPEAQLTYNWWPTFYDSLICQDQAIIDSKVSCLYWVK